MTQKVDRSTTLSPFVYWGQTDSTITLRVDLKNVKVNFDGCNFIFLTGIIFSSIDQNPAIDLKGNTLNFYAQGVGAKGLNDYAFLIEFFQPVHPDVRFDALLIVN